MSSESERNNNLKQETEDHTLSAYVLLNLLNEFFFATRLIYSITQE